jgi:hypothetical protein
LTCAYPCTAPSVDYGFNPTVAADNNEAPSATSTTVVEVHQTGTGDSALYYHVGILSLSPSPSISWGASLPVSSTFLGSAPTVSIAHNVAVLVAQGSGELWYSIGVVDTATSTISWSTPTSYGTGYNPTVSVFGPGLWISGRVLVEAHQVDNATGQLVYSVGRLKGPSPTSITWSTTTSGTLDTNIPYATGCYPSVALATDGYTASLIPSSPSQVSVTETHAIACGSAVMSHYSYGYLLPH